MPANASGDLANLARAKYIRLITYRRSGDAVATPVWFAAVDATLYIDSGKNAGKVKRIRHTPHAAVASCDFRGHVTGPMIEGTARVLSDAAEIAIANNALARKYGIAHKLYFAGLELVRALRRRPPLESDYLAITLGEE